MQEGGSKQRQKPGTGSHWRLHLPMKMMEGLWARACANKSLTLAGPTPTNISMKSDPLILRKGTAASPAVAFANKVFPVPGGPTNRAPLGILAPSSLYLPGVFRKLTNSMTSCLASSQPATSCKMSYNEHKLRQKALHIKYSIGVQMAYCRVEK